MFCFVPSLASFWKKIKEKESQGDREVPSTAPTHVISLLQGVRGQNRRAA
jgi:hypothetical protein